jgi:hypothetical protein
MEIGVISAPIPQRAVNSRLTKVSVGRGKVAYRKATLGESDEQLRTEIKPLLRLFGPPTPIQLINEAFVSASRR